MEKPTKKFGDATRTKKVTKKDKKIKSSENKYNIKPSFIEIRTARVLPPINTDSFSTTLSQIANQKKTEIQLKAKSVLIIDSKCNQDHIENSLFNHLPVSI